MGNLFFPQLSSGAIAQYPVKKTNVVRSVTNLLPDGSMILQADTPASKLVWEMNYSELEPADAIALQSHFQACRGPYYAFTFIDPTDNMFASSVDLTASVWSKDPQIQITAGASDPIAGTNAFVLTNEGSAVQKLSQQLTVPATYQYCFSLYAMSAQPSTVTVMCRGANATANSELAVSTIWNRIVSSGRLNDPGTELNVGVMLQPGQQITLYGLQLEAQIQPSRYRPTVTNGGVYANAHFVSATLSMTSNAPSLFSTRFAIQTNTQVTDGNN
jgi:hypothetical protein